MVRHVQHLESALRYVQNFRTAVDGGAHIGLWSKRLACDFTEVLAFEPYKPHVAELGNIEGVEVFPVALGANEGFAGLEPGPANDGQWHIAFGDDVRVRRLDSYGFEHIDFLKLDVEGYEWQAMLGAAQTIDRSRPVIVIEANDLCRRYGVDPDEPARWLGHRGYHCVEKLGRDEVWVP